MGAEHVLPIVLGALRQKLQNKALQLVDNLYGKGAKINPETANLRNIAAEEGFSDEAWLLNEVLLGIGERVCENALEERESRIERERKEKQLEDYLVSGEHLEEVKKGLKFAGRQNERLSGVTDISARDSNGRQITLELKARDYDPDKTAVQMAGYLNEKPGENGILVLPNVHPSLFFGLKHFVDGGRLEFYTFKETHEGYRFELFNPASFNEQEIAKARERARQNKGNGHNGDEGYVCLPGTKRAKGNRRQAKKGHEQTEQVPASESASTSVLAQSEQQQGNGRLEKKGLSVAQPKIAIFREQRAKLEGLLDENYVLADGTRWVDYVREAGKVVDDDNVPEGLLNKIQCQSERHFLRLKKIFQTLGNNSRSSLIRLLISSAGLKRILCSCDNLQGIKYFFGDTQLAYSNDTRLYYSNSPQEVLSLFEYERRDFEFRFRTDYAKTVLGFINDILKTDKEKIRSLDTLNVGAFANEWMSLKFARADMLSRVGSFSCLDYLRQVPSQRDIKHILQVLDCNSSVYSGIGTNMPIIPMAFADANAYRKALDRVAQMQQ